MTIRATHSRWPDPGPSRPARGPGMNTDGALPPPTWLGLGAGLTSTLTSNYSPQPPPGQSPGGFRGAGYLAHGSLEPGFSSSLSPASRGSACPQPGSSLLTALPRHPQTHQRREGRLPADLSAAQEPAGRGHSCTEAVLPERLLWAWAHAAGSEIELPVLPLRLSGGLLIWGPTPPQTHGLHAVEEAT